MEADDYVMQRVWCFIFVIRLQPQLVQYTHE